MSENAGSQSGPAPSDRVVIGLAFGNSNSSIAYTVDDKAEVIANEDGDRQIPSILSYVDGDEYYGQQAKAFLVRNPKNSIGYFKEFVGQDFASIDPTHNHASAHPQEADGVITFTVNDKDAETPSTISVSEVSTRFLRRLVGSASDYIGKKVTSAVVTVPTNYSDKQKAALIKAATDAGLEVLQLIAEPVAAALAYDARPEAEVSDKIVVVADLGGTRSDVAVLASRGGMYTILATAHDYEFAGCHLDDVLIEHFSKEFIKKHQKDPRTNAKSLAKLKFEAEATKKALSIGTNASFSVESLIDGFDFASTVNRLRYEMSARKVFEGINRLIEGVIKKAGLDVLDIDEVVLSGGTSHTPRIANNLVGLFPASTKIVAPATSATAINPSELQARGAALQASLIQEYESDDIDQSTHPAVTTVKHTANAIGVVTRVADDDVFTPIVPAETAVPARRTVHVPVPKAGGDVLIRVVEGGTHIKVTKPEPKEKKADGSDDDSDDDGSDDDDDEEEEHREKVWKIGSTVAEAAIRGVKAGGKVEVTINVSADLGVTVTAREVGGKGGIRGQKKREYAAGGRRSMDDAGSGGDRSQELSIEYMRAWDRDKNDECRHVA
ncbi:Ribosome-associated complex subunit SSZ1 like protein [Verticillium longisporum]|nr:Ribosome-associated complex subunit SSZ1 like protein [Verticillium longisporum]